MERTQNRARWLSAIGVVSMSIGIAAAQSGSISGMYVFPKRGQPPEQQQQDEMQCHSTAVEMTGFNPSAAASAPPPSQGAPAGSGARGAVRGAAGGAALGAAMGAIAGDAGKGAAMGAAGGGMVGGVRGRRQGQEQQAAQQQAGQMQQQAQRQEYQRAFSACMDARGYSVK
jgi:Glycine zipper